MSPSDGLTDEEIRELGYERTSRGWMLRENAEEHRETGLTKGQWRRFSSLTVRGLVVLPDSGWRAFLLATSLGKMMTKEGTFERLRRGELGLGVVVRPNVRDRVIDLLEADDPDRRMWRKHVSEWIEAGLAHRCKSQPRGSVTLFLSPRMAARCVRERTSQYRTTGPLSTALRYSGVPLFVPVEGVALRDGEGGVRG